MTASLAARSQRSFVPMRNFRVVPFRLWLILASESFTTT
jgi:hypothetical protein